MDLIHDYEPKRDPEIKSSPWQRVPVLLLCDKVGFGKCRINSRNHIGMNLDSGFLHCFIKLYFT